MMAAIKFSNQFLVSVVTSLLLLNLYFTPLSLLCKRQHQDIQQVIENFNHCHKFDVVRQKISSIQPPIKNPDLRSGLTSILPCSEIEKLVQKLKTLKLCERRKSIVQVLENMRTVKKVDDVKLIFNDIKQSLNVTQVLNKLQMLKNITDNLKMSDEMVQILHKTREELNIKVHRPSELKPLPWASSEFAKQMYTLEQDLRKELKMFSDSTKLAVEAREVFLNSGYLDLSIHLPEMTEYLSTRDEDVEKIFFTETSGTGSIRPRFVCAVESAAKAYPKGEIYLLIAYVPTYGFLKIANEALINVLENYPNVHALRVDMDKLFLKSPLEPFYNSGKLQKSTFLAAHTSDVIRILVVWKYGGKYFDLDIMTVKNLSSLKNFIIQEANFTDNNVANGAFAFEKGSKLGDWMFRLLNKEFLTDDWTGNGPRVLTLAMRNYTGSPTVTGMDETNLKEFKKLVYETLFPINFNELTLYFNEEQSDKTMARILNTKGLWGMHIGNNIAQNMVVKVGSKMPYGLLAEKFCPRAYWSAYEEF